MKDEEIIARAVKKLADSENENRSLERKVHDFFEILSESEGMRNAISIASPEDIDFTLSGMHLMLAHWAAGSETEWMLTGRCCLLHSPYLAEAQKDGTFQNRCIKYIGEDLDTVKLCRWDSLKRAIDEQISCYETCAAWRMREMDASYVPEFVSREEKTAWDMRISYMQELGMWIFEHESEQGIYRITMSDPMIDVFFCEKPIGIPRHETSCAALTEAIRYVSDRIGGGENLSECV